MSYNPNLYFPVLYYLGRYSQNEHRNISKLNKFILNYSAYLLYKVPKMKCTIPM